MRVDDFDFELPQSHIALRPASPRSSAKLLCVNGGSGLGASKISDHFVEDLPSLLRAGDILVFNDTKVIPAQLFGTKIGGQAKFGVTLHKRDGLRQWVAFIRNAKRLKIGDGIDFGHDVLANAIARHDDGSFTLEFGGDEPVEILLSRAGTMPLPPYIAGKRPADERDLTDYQTLFAQKDGAVAAPTAALHFTDDIMDSLARHDIGHEIVTLHVGAGTFLPVKADDTKEHVMHSEWGEVSADTAKRLNVARKQGRRIIAVGTTSLRLIESATNEQGETSAFADDTDIFITPGYQFRGINGLMTNFHLPRSTLFMLVSALMGLETMQTAYAHAISHGYRFYSYGDASLLLP